MRRPSPLAPVSNGNVLARAAMPAITGILPPSASVAQCAQKCIDTSLLRHLPVSMHVRTRPAHAYSALRPRIYLSAASCMKLRPLFAGGLFAEPSTSSYGALETFAPHCPTPSASNYPESNSPATGTDTFGHRALPYVKALRGLSLCSWHQRRVLSTVQLFRRSHLLNVVVGVSLHARKHRPIVLQMASSTRQRFTLHRGWKWQ